MTNAISRTTPPLRELSAGVSGRITGLCDATYCRLFLPNEIASYIVTQTVGVKRWWIIGPSFNSAHIVSNTHGILWWRHQMEIFSALLAICAGNSQVTGEFPAQRPVIGSFDVFFDLRLNKPLSKQSWGWWFETPLRPWWRHCNAFINVKLHQCYSINQH